MKTSKSHLPSSTDLSKTYDASQVEDAIYAAWEKSGAFKPAGKGDPYCIVLPPPNRTGVLHLGHAIMLAIQDLLIRFQRMQGKRTLWIPGTDHAAIATQVKAEDELRKQGMKNPRQELGREKFLAEVVKFAEQSHATITKQVRKMGSSCDWTQEKYTLDEERSRAVNQTFKMMYEDGVIERGYRIVNWDPKNQTTLSDEEVEYVAQKARFITFKYDAKFPIAISTTRPETKFGDTAVAVHPDDRRYKKFVGKTFEPVFCGKKLSIKIIADSAVDPEFGTGALGVTPAHSMIDADMALRHDLPTVAVIGPDAKMADEAGADFAGLSAVQAREKIEIMLKKNGLLEKVEEVEQNLPVAQRGGAAVEQLPMRQWFVRVNKPFKLRQDTLVGADPRVRPGQTHGFAPTGGWKKGDKATLKDLMRYAVDSKQIKIVPERFTKVYFHWIDNLRDWCISRQIWFGHRIPVWYKNVGAGSPRPGAETAPLPETEFVVSDVSPGAGWEQDPDTLDTWFSSGLWTFSTLGWPPSAKASASAEASADKSGGRPNEWEKNRGFHPTSVLETGYDILFFWVARMILMSTYALGEIPFHDVYLHGLVRDEQGRKMSKSLGNVIDPLDVIAKYGTDAVRLALVIGTTPGQDMNLSESKIEGYRNFTNKLWNISRYVLTQLDKEGLKTEAPLLKTDADHWIFRHFSNALYITEDAIEKYALSRGGEQLRAFTWDYLADWYLEISKSEKGKEKNLSFILSTLLRLWHPYMPFVTEYIWGIAGCKKLLISSEWPKYEDFRKQLDEKWGYDDVRAGEFEWVVQLVTDIRRRFAELGSPDRKKIECSFDAPKVVSRVIERNLETIKHLLGVSSIRMVDDTPVGWDSFPAGPGRIEVGLNLAGAVDLVAEKAKLEKELKEAEAYISSLKKKLANKEFTSKAPKKIVDEMKAKKVEAEEKFKALKERLNHMA